ncbi:MAG: hypothetical protein HY097_00620, partial [Nitrospinae bacterium]|nr:hypothetical protein [Nitrospinota bacterium]
YCIVNHYFILSIIIFILGSIFAYLLSMYMESEEDRLIEFEHLKGIKTPLGEIALEKGMLTVNRLAKILKEQSKTGELFGKIAVRRGFLTEKEIKALLKIQHERELMSIKKYENKNPVTKDTKISPVSSTPTLPKLENRRNKVTPLPSFHSSVNMTRIR